MGGIGDPFFPWSMGTFLGGGGWGLYLGVVLCMERYMWLMSLEDTLGGVGKILTTL